MLSYSAIIILISDIEAIQGGRNYSINAEDGWIYICRVGAMKLLWRCRYAWMAFNILISDIEAIRGSRHYSINTEDGWKKEVGLEQWSRCGYAIHGGWKCKYAWMASGNHYADVEAIWGGRDHSKMVENVGMCKEH